MSVLRKGDYQLLAKYVVVGHWGKCSAIGSDGREQREFTFTPNVVQSVYARTLSMTQTQCQLASNVNVCASGCL